MYINIPYPFGPHIKDYDTWDQIKMAKLRMYAPLQNFLSVLSEYYTKMCQTDMTMSVELVLSEKEKYKIYH